MPDAIDAEVTFLYGIIDNEIKDSTQNKLCKAQVNQWAGNLRTLCPIIAKNLKGMARQDAQRQCQLISSLELHELALPMIAKSRAFIDNSNAAAASAKALKEKISTLMVAKAKPAAMTLPEIKASPIKFLKEALSNSSRFSYGSLVAQEIEQDRKMVHGVVSLVKKATTRPIDNFVSSGGLREAADLSLKEDLYAGILVSKLAGAAARVKHHVIMWPIHQVCTGEYGPKGSTTELVSARRLVCENVPYIASQVRRLVTKHVLPTTVKNTGDDIKSNLKTFERYGVSKEMCEEVYDDITDAAQGLALHQTLHLIPH